MRTACDSMLIFLLFNIGFLLALLPMDNINDHICVKIKDEQGVL